MANLAELVGKARALKAKITEIEAAHSEQLAPYKGMLVQLNQIFLAHLNATGGQNFSCDQGGFHKITRISVSLENPSEFMSHVIGSESWDLLDRKANATAVADYLKTNGILPPGVKQTMKLDIGVTAPVKKVSAAGARTSKLNGVPPVVEQDTL